MTEELPTLSDKITEAQKPLESQAHLKVPELVNLPQNDEPKLESLDKGESEVIIDSEIKVNEEKKEENLTEEESKKELNIVNNIENEEISNKNNKEKEVKIEERVEVKSEEKSKENDIEINVEAKSEGKKEGGEERINEEKVEEKLDKKPEVKEETKEEEIIQEKEHEKSNEITENHMEKHTENSIDPQEKQLEIQDNSSKPKETDPKEDNMLYIKKEQEELDQYIDQFKSVDDLNTEANNPLNSPKTNFQIYQNNSKIPKNPQKNQKSSKNITKNNSKITKKKNKNCSMDDFNSDLLVDDLEINGFFSPLRHKKLTKEEEEKFEQTYARFNEEDRRRKEKIAEMKKRLEEREIKNCCFRPKINKYSKELTKNNKDDFLTRQKKCEESHKRKDEQLKKNLEEKRVKEINKTKFIKKNKGSKEDKNDKKDIGKTIDKLYEWDKKRKIKIERQQKKCEEKEMRQTFCPAINKRSHLLITTKNKNKNNKNVFTRLYRDEYEKTKERKRLLEQIYTPTFNPKINSEKRIKFDKKPVEELKSPSEYLSNDLEDIFRGRIKLKMNKKQVRTQSAIDMRRERLGSNDVDEERAFSEE